MGVTRKQNRKKGEVFFFFSVFVQLFELMFDVSVNNFSVMLGQSHRRTVGKQTSCKLSFAYHLVTSQENLTFWTQPKFRNKCWNRFDLPNTLDLLSLMTWNGVNMFLKFLVNQLRHWVFFSAIWLLHLSIQRELHTKHWFVCSSYLASLF